VPEVLGYYHITLTGSAHMKSDYPICQDAGSVRVLSGGWIAAAVADGVGSAKYSQIGSSLAVENVLSFVEAYKPAKWDVKSLKALLITAYHRAMEAVRARASNEGDDLSEYDTTLTTVIYNGRHLVYGHVGDGGIVALTPFGEFKKLTVPQKGEMFNEVVPLRGGPDHWVFGNSEEEICALTMMTDGVYDIACPLVLSKKEIPIYLQYIRRWMDLNVLEIKTKEDFRVLQEKVRKALTEEELNTRFTDDKTIVGIINTDVVPEEQPAEYYKEPDWKRLKEDRDAVLYPPNLPETAASKPGDEPDTTHADIKPVNDVILSGLSLKKAGKTCFGGKKEV
jgi:serine/threonine protein phosphatase PrpC